MGCNFGSEMADDKAYLPTEANMGLLMQTCPCIVSPSYTPLLYRKTGVHYFLNFALKHRLWVF